MLTFAVLLVTGGRLRDIFGQRPLFVARLAVFSAASALCGAAQGVSAIRAGTITPITLTMAAVSPFTGRLTDRIGGRCLLLVGFVLAAAGVAGVAAVESVNAGSFTFTLPFVAIGLGMGCVIAPLATEALREVPPVLAGAASGMLDTSRQLGPDRMRRGAGGRYHREPSRRRCSRSPAT